MAVREDKPEPGKQPTAKLFKHGRSQAVRLPKAFRFDGTEVRVSKVGDKVILEPLQRGPAEIAAVFAAIDKALDGDAFLSDGIPEDSVVEPDGRPFFG